MGWSDKYKKSINCDNPKGFSQRAHCQGRKKKMKEAKDHEVSMAQSQLDKTIDNAKKLKKKLGTKEKNIPAWVQAKVTDTDHNMDAAASYSEETKSGDQGLRDWFGKSKSSDGKKGWVQLGGKYAGKPCARQPGQTSTPKCGSSKMKRNLDKDEEQAAFRRKNRQDPNQPQKSGGAKPTNVRTEDMDINEAKDKPGKGSGTKDACYHKVKSRYSVWPSAYASGALVKCRKKGAANWGNSTKKEGMEEFYNLPELTEMQIKVLQNQGYDVEIVDEACWKGYEKKGMKTMFGKRYPNCVKKEETEVEEGKDWIKGAIKKPGALKRELGVPEDETIPAAKLKKAEKAGGKLGQRARLAATLKGLNKEETEIQEKLGDFRGGNLIDVKPHIRMPFSGDKVTTHSGGGAGAALGGAAAAGLGAAAGVVASKLAQKKKEKEKKPTTTSEAALTAGALGTAAALGAVGGLASGAAGALSSKMTRDALNKKKKKEETKVEEGFLTKKTPEELERIKKEKAIKAREKKIKTYAALMRHAKDKTSDVARPTVKKEGVTIEDADGNTFAEVVDIIKPEPMKGMAEGMRLPSQYGSVYIVTFGWRGKYHYLKMFFPQPNKPTKAEVTAAVDKVYPGARVSAYTETAVGQGDSYFNAGSTDGGDGGKEPNVFSRFGESTDLTGPEYNKMVSKRQLSDKKRSRREADANTSTDNGQMEEVQIEEGTPAWQRKEGKNPEGGLNQKGVDSYRRANPGSKLKTAVTTKPSKLKKGSKAANRRKSFCSRMKGMKKKLTSAKTANDPDSRINKSLRKWNC